MGDHQARVDAGVIGEERGEVLVAGNIHHPVGAALGHRGDVGGDDGEEVQRVGQWCAVEVAVR